MKKQNNDWVFIKGDKYCRGPFPKEPGLYKVLIAVGDIGLKERYAYYYPATFTWGLDKDVADKIVAWRR